ncbi:MAG: gamma-glutamylcyclotransferase [Planctomycetes bacterium]|nr:gamma-glutamylcyclotransferase [Planctomycetota bacterium]
MSAERSALFVYGTLMRGERSERFLSASPLLDPDARVDGYELVDTGSYPGLVRSAQGVVRGELYEVTREELVVIDEFEGHPDLFERVEVELASGRRAFVYLFRQAAGQPLVPDGDWRAHRTRRENAD